MFKFAYTHIFVKFRGSWRLTPQSEGMQIMVSLGLTLRQAKIYIAIIQSGICTVSKVSWVSGVPREHVYRIIPKLQNLGLIEKIIDRPTKFKATPVQDVIPMLMNKRTNATNELSKKSRCFLKNFNDENTKTNNQEYGPQFVLIPKKVALARKRGNAIENAQTSVDVVTSWKRYSQATFECLEMMRKALKRGVIIRHIMEKPEDKRSLAIARKIEQLFNEYPSFKVKYIRTSITAILAVFDNKEVILITTPTLELNHAPALWSNNPSLVELAKKYFEMMWTESLQIKKEESISIPF